MDWVQGAINKRVVEDMEGAWITTARDEQTARQIVYDHNIRIITVNNSVGNVPGWPQKTPRQIHQEFDRQVDKIVAAAGWTDHL